MTRPSDPLFDVSGEIVLITGVAGQLGVEYAHSFLERGARVIGLDVRSSEGSGDLVSKFLNPFLAKVFQNLN